jgi:cytoskeletal protein RodZ
MADRSELLERLKKLSSTQFDEVVFDLEIDQSIIPSSFTAQSTRAIKVIELLEQRPDGLTQLEEVLSSSRSNSSEEFPLKASSMPLWKVGLGLLGFSLLVFIGFTTLHKATQTSNQPTPSTSNNNSSKEFPPSSRSTPSASNDSSDPCSQGYKFNGSGPGPSGEYSGRCEPTSSDTGASPYPCIVRSSPCIKPSNNP